MPSPVSPMSPFSQQNFIPETPDVNLQLVNRHSLSLRGDPHSGSVAEEILYTVYNPVNTYAKAKTLLSDLKEMSERLSDFGSCRDSSSIDGSSSSDGSYKVISRKQKRKKSRSKTPERRSFLKKQNTASSPLYL